MGIYRIAIDGPSGAGKSTAAQLLAEKLNIDYVDTGAMYRAIAVKLIRTGTDYDDPQALEELLKNTDVDYYGGRVYLDGEDVSGIIRTPEATELSSKSSVIPAVRDKLGELQSEMAKKRSLLMDGRDIGTYIIPDAEYKFYLDASSRERAKRRWLQMKAEDASCSIDEVEKKILERDYRDSHRDYHPLKKADDAIEIDTSNMTIDEVIDEMMGYIHEEK